MLSDGPAPYVSAPGMVEAEPSAGLYSEMSCTPSCMGGAFTSSRPADMDTTGAVDRPIETVVLATSPDPWITSVVLPAALALDGTTLLPEKRCA